jgi:hypothetical protein
MGLIGSAALLVVLSLVWIVRSPWMSADVTPTETVDGWTHLSVGFTNHGYGDFGRKIVNVLVPDDVGIGRIEGAGTVSTAQVRDAPDESIDGVHGSVYWGEVIDFIQGKHMLLLAVATDRRKVRIRIRIGTPRRDLRVDLPQDGRAARSRVRVRPRMDREASAGFAHDRQGRHLVRVLGVTVAAVSDGADLPPPDWYPDPDQPNTLRYWDGEHWTEQRAPRQSRGRGGGPPGEVIFGFVAAGLMVIGAIGPWVDAFLVTVAGLSGDGWIVLVAAVAALIGLAYASSSKTRGLLGPIAVIVILAGLVAAATSIYDLSQILGTKAELFGEDISVANPGWGLWLSAGASVALIMAGVALFSLDRRRRTSSVTS